MKISIWASSGPKIGGGHVSRCQVLKAALESYGCDVDFKPESQRDALTELLKAKTYDLLVLDDYSIDAVFEKHCRQWVGHIFCIDDLANRPHECDLLLDPTPGRTPADYQNRVSRDCRLLLGPQYALVAAAFAHYRPQSLRYHQTRTLVEKIIISFGATDPDDWSSPCLEALVPIMAKATIDVTLTDAAPHLDHVKKLCNAVGAVLHVNSPNMPYLMANADLAIGACGGSSWERCCLGLPSIVGIIASNQVYVAKALMDNKSALVLTGGRAEFSSKILDAVNGLALNPKLLKELSINAAVLCDGNGAQRVARTIIEHFDYSKIN